jgi:hypothetical protein
MTDHLGTVRVTPEFQSKLQYMLDRAGVRKSDLVRYALTVMIGKDPNDLCKCIGDWKAKTNEK